MISFSNGFKKPTIVINKAIKLVTFDLFMMFILLILKKDKINMLFLTQILDKFSVKDIFRRSNYFKVLNRNIINFYFRNQGKIKNVCCY